MVSIIQNRITSAQEILLLLGKHLIQAAALYNITIQHTLFYIVFRRQSHRHTKERMGGKVEIAANKKKVKMVFKEKVLFCS